MRISAKKNRNSKIYLAQAGGTHRPSLEVAAGMPSCTEDRADRHSPHVRRQRAARRYRKGVGRHLEAVDKVH